MRIYLIVAGEIKFFFVRDHTAPYTELKKQIVVRSKLIRCRLYI